MTGRISPVLKRKHPVALRRAFLLRFGRRRARRGGPVGAPASCAADNATSGAMNDSESGAAGGGIEAYRAHVAAMLGTQFGVALPRGLRALVDGAARRDIPAEALVAFLGETFDLEPLAS
jgi:hypothetical protein